MGAFVKRWIFDVSPVLESTFLTSIAQYGCGGSPQKNLVVVGGTETARLSQEDQEELCVFKDRSLDCHRDANDNHV